MVKFIDVDPNEIDDLKQVARGRVSYPLLKTFLETGKYVVIVDRTGMQQSLQGLLQSLRSYIRAHNLPIKPFVRKSQLLLMRLDIDKNGNPDPSWVGSIGLPEPDAGEETEINEEEIARRFEVEKHKATK